MKITRRITALMTVLCCLASAACAQTDLTDRSISNGNVAAVSFVDITAPCSGTLTSFDLEKGDSVTAGDTLFTMLTTAITAPEDGTVTALFVEDGSDATAVMSRYGAVASIEPAGTYRLTATTAGAYNDNDNKLLHVGETLYFQSQKGDKDKCTGRVISVSGTGYVVDVLTGDVEIGENLTLYRTDGYNSKDNVGKGVVTRLDPVTVQAAGKVCSVLVSAGDTVTAGQPLMTVLSADADPGTRPEITAPADGVIAAVAVSAGQQVWKGEVLARLYLTDTLEIVASVDEMDLGTLRVGDLVPVTLDMDKDNVLNGTVTEISDLGVTSLNAAYFTVHISLPYSNGLKLGASASVYLPKN